MTNAKLRLISKQYADQINGYVADHGLNDSAENDVITIFDDDAKDYPSGQRVDVTFKMHTSGDGLPNNFDMGELSMRNLDLKDKHLSNLIKEYLNAIK